jgi:hypothetical protein
MVYDTGVDWNIHFFSFLFCSNHLVLEDRDHVNIDFGTLDQRCFNKDSNIGTRSISINQKLINHLSLFNKEKRTSLNKIIQPSLQD